MISRRLFKSRLSPDELYNRWLSWLPLIAAAGLAVLVLVAIMHSIGPDAAIASQCQMSAGKCYPMRSEP